MAFTIGSGTFTNGSATVTGVTLTSGTLAYFASGTRMVVGVNPIVQEVEAIAAPTVSTITLRSAWTGTGGTYSFLANQTSEGLRDAVQAIRTNNASLQSFIDSIDTAATADSVAQRTSDGSINAVDVNATRLLTTGNVGIGTSTPDTRLMTNGGTVKFKHDQVAVSQVVLDNQAYNTTAAGYAISATDSTFSAAMGKITFGRDGLYNETSASRSSYIGFSTVSAGTETERLRIDSSGNVGIGTSAPINAAGFKAATISGSSGGAVVFQAGAATAGSVASFADDMYFDSVDQIIFRNGDIFNGSPAERMRIDSSGSVLVGYTASLSSTIGVRSTVSANPCIAMFNTAGSGSHQIKFYNSNTTSLIGSITNSGNTSTAYNTTSDYRLKEDWQPMDCACDRVMQLNPVNFAWKSSGERVDGFLAHELQEVIPEAVTGEKDETEIEEYEVEPAVYEDAVIPAEFDEDGNEVSPERTEQKLVKEAVMGEREVPVYQGIDQSKVVPLLTAALQHALKDIADLKARIEALEG